VKKHLKKITAKKTTAQPPDAIPDRLDHTSTLKSLMANVGLSNFKALYNLGLSKKQVQRLRRGEIQHLRLQTLLKFSQALKLSLAQVVQTFGPSTGSPLPDPDTANETLLALQQEFQRLQTQLQEQRQTLWQEFQQQSLQIIESWLLQWPNAAYAARNNPAAPAVKLLPLARPIEQLLQSWGITPIGEVGKDMIYDPRWHETLAGETITPGTAVRVRHVGYQQGERLLYRAKVSMAAENPSSNS
jgi:molecular chaperone GrpE (heat shock protein)/DNA-binding Xre family transcriptional regulator